VFNIQYVSNIPKTAKCQMPAKCQYS
jgi:hypothetical protein